MKKACLVFGTLCFVLAAATSAGAQSKPLTFVRDTSWNLRKLGYSRVSQVFVRSNGRMLMVPEYYQAEVQEVDSNFKKLPWRIQTSRSLTSGEIAWIGMLGLVGDSAWVMDPGFQQIAFVGMDGKVKTSIGFPSWIRPFWRDRRKYPLFSQLAWRGAYPDGSLLVVPRSPRRLLDTPGYDPDRGMFVRIDRDGRILKTVATFPEMDGRMQLRSGTDKQWVNVPNYAKTLSAVSDDAQRVVIVEPLPSDSGAFRITALNPDGDTVFTRRYTVEAYRLPKARADSVVSNMKGFGRYSDQQVRDTMRKLMPSFYSPIQGSNVGSDYSVWVRIRRPSTKMEDADYYVVDAKGEPQGIVTVPGPTKFASLSLDKLWVVEQDRAKNSTTLIRFVRRGAKGAPPSRSAKAAASSTQAR